MANVVVANKVWLREVDGKICDCDHGVDMAKGFLRASDRIRQADLRLDQAMTALSDVPSKKISGSMGSLFALIFEDLATSIHGKALIGAKNFSAMRHAVLDVVSAAGSPKVGDKTLIKTLAPSVAASDFDAARGFAPALVQMARAAEAGCDGTINRVVRVGRGARLGERSRGVLDAGATSCCLILVAMAGGLTARLSAWGVALSGHNW